MVAKSIKTLELHYPAVQFLLIVVSHYVSFQIETNATQASTVLTAV